MANLGGWEILIIVLIIVLLFGAKKLPDAARSLGRSMRIFKSEVKEMSNDDKPQQPSQIEPPQGNTNQPNAQQNFQNPARDQQQFPNNGTTHQ